MDSHPTAKGDPSAGNRENDPANDADIADDSSGIDQEKHVAGVENWISRRKALKMIRQMVGRESALTVWASPDGSPSAIINQ